MIKNSKGIGFPQGEEENNDPAETGKVVSKTTKASSSMMINNVSSSPWLRLKDPRIVRVSRVFGGKDRHSKVCTVRGLRDRRVRLSVPTAIQLYDLQDRLGLNQPSKVVDWLLNAAKEEIDELPPLPMPMPGAFALLPPPRSTAEADEANPSNIDQNQGVIHKNNSNTMEWESGNSSSSRLAGQSSSFCSPSQNASSDTDPWNSRSKEVMLARDHQTAEDGKETLRGARNNVNELVITERDERNDNTVYQRSNMNHPFFPGMINNIAYNMSNSYRWEPPNYPLLMSHLGGGYGGGLTDHNHHGLNVMSLQPSTLSLSTGSQFLFGPNTSATASVGSGHAQFPNLSRDAESHEPRQGVNHFHMLSSNPMRSLFHFGASNSTNDNNIGSPNEQSKERE